MKTTMEEGEEEGEAALEGGGGGGEMAADGSRNGKCSRQGCLK
jgi:hypothetical protein